MKESKDKELSERWKVWVDENSSRLLAYARSRTQDASEAEDLLQDALVKLWAYQKERAYEPPDLPLAFSVMRFLLLDHGRQRGRQDRRDRKIIQFQQAQDDCFEPAFELDDEARILRAEVEKLPEKLKEAVILKTWGGLTFMELGEVLKVSQNTAASRYRYALEQLQKNLNHLKNTKNG